ncbi:MAG TPA: hypothetical protein VMI12_10955 [Puia sp.]|nr:hypothetical protein [Puia sp.]
MGQKVTAVILLIAMAGSAFNKVIALIDYNLNKEFIASTLCENRDRPACCCKGKCFLKKQLQKGETDKNGSNSAKQKFNTDVFQEDGLNSNLFSFQGNIAAFENYQSSLYTNSLQQVFHPPAKL